MIFEIYSKDPDRLLENIIKAINENSSRHMEHWEIVSDKGENYITQRDIKYFFKVLLKPEVRDGQKIRFSLVYNQYSDPTHFIKCEYMGQFTECILFNFGDVIKGIQIYAQQS